MRKLFIIFVLLFSLPVVGWSAVITAANGGGNWSSTGTWVGGVVPVNGTDTVIIPATLTAAVVLDDSRTIPATTIEDEVYGLVQGSSVTTTLGGALAVGNGTSKDGKFTFGAGATLALGSNNVSLNNCALRSNATTTSWATISGTGAIVLGSVLTMPKQDTVLRYVSHQNTGAITYSSGGFNGGGANILDIKNCVFTGNGALTFGQTGVTTAATVIEVNNNDFLDLSGDVTVTGQAGTVDRQFKNNTLSTSGTIRTVKALTNTDFTGSVFYRIVPSGVHTHKTIFDKIFVGSDSSPHILVPAISGRVFANSYLYSAPTTTNPHVANIYYNTATDNDVIDNVFDIGGTEPNVILILGGNASSTGDITGNLHIGRGALVNVVGNNTFGTVNVKNNTVHTNEGGSSVHQGIFLAENGNPTGTLNITNNLHNASGVTLSASLWDNDASPASIALSDYNNFYGLSDGTPYEAVSVVSGQTNDLINTVDPGFVDANRNLMTWGQTIHGTDGTAAAAIAKLLAINGYNSTTKTQSDTPSGASVQGTTTSLVNWVRAGFAPTNATLSTAGDGGTLIGALDVVALGSSAALMMGL